MVGWVKNTDPVTLERPALGAPQGAGDLERWCACQELHAIPLGVVRSGDGRGARSVAAQGDDDVDGTNAVSPLQAEVAVRIGIGACALVEDMGLRSWQTIAADHDAMDKLR